WTYDLQGALVLTPDFADVAHFERSASGLLPVGIGVWSLWVFATLASAGRSLDDDLGHALIERVAKLKLDRLQWFERRSYTLACNWKVFVDNYLDGGYHVPHLHRGLNSVLDYRSYSVEIGDRFCVQSSALAKGVADPATAAVR